MTKAKEERPRLPIGLLVFLALHLPLGLLMHLSATVATLHALVTVLGALALAAAHPRLEMALYAAGYVVGAELLWRMNGATVPWEIGKYAVVLVLLISSVRLRARGGSRIPIVYFALLLPSVVVLETETFHELRSDLSFNLSGPLCLAVATWYFSRLKLAMEDHRQLRWAMIAPAIAVSAITIFVRSTFENLQYTTSSSYASSGGYGPNQVSAMLGLAVVLCYFAVLDQGMSRTLRILAGVLMVLFGTQSAMTFSRGGLYSAAISLAAAMVIVSRRPKDVLRWVVLAGAVALVAEVYVVPTLVEETDGKIAERFSSTRTTGRAEMVRSEVGVFLDHPFLGVGPGGGKRLRLEGRSLAAHTEFSRLPAEHGIFGVVAILLMAAMALNSFRRASPGINRANAAAFCLWGLTFMVHAAMRLAAPGFIFGLAAAGLAASKPVRASAPAPVRRDPAMDLSAA